MVVVPPGTRNMNASMMPVEQVAVKSSMTAEQRLTDYIAQVQAEGLATGQQLSNPAALGSAALNALNGYFERVKTLQDNAGRKTQAMSDEKTDSTTADEAASQLPAGPANNNLQLVSNRREIPPEKVQRREPRLSEADLDRAIDAMLSVMTYSFESSMITTATNNISKSASTLMRGQ